MGSKDFNSIDCSFDSITVFSLCPEAKFNTPPPNRLISLVEESSRQRKVESVTNNLCRPIMEKSKWSRKKYKIHSLERK